MTEPHYDSTAALRKLAAALGIPHLPIQQIVLDINVDCIPRIYVKSMLPKEAFPAFIEVCEHLEVTPDLEVHTDG